MIRSNAHDNACVVNTHQTVHSGISAVRLTAPGRGAVATVRLSCLSADRAVTIDAAFTAANGMLASSMPVNRALYGSWRGEDVVVVRTSATDWEVHCHGGEAAVSRIVTEFPDDTSSPAVPSSPLEQLLLQTRTTKTARLVLAQSNGVLREAILAAIRSVTTDVIRRQLTELLKWERIAGHLVVPWRVVIAGPPNVGKSSLLNAVAGYSRSIVTDQPGTTRDAVQVELVLSGWPFCFVDTAGIRRDSSDPVELTGIRRAQNLLHTADLVLIAVDSTVGWTSDHDDIVLGTPEQCLSNAVYCRNDLPVSGASPPDEFAPLSTSAVTGDGIRELTEWLTSQLVTDEPTLETALPLAGTADICRVLLQRLGDGQSLESVQQELAEWLKSQTW